MTRRSGLGRGLAALIPPSPEEAEDPGSTDDHDAEVHDAEVRDTDSREASDAAAGEDGAGDRGAGDTRAGDLGAVDTDEDAPQASASETSASETGGLEVTDREGGDAGPRDPGTDASDVAAREPAPGHAQDHDRVRSPDWGTPEDPERYQGVTSDGPSAGATVDADVPVGSNSPGIGDRGVGGTSEAEAASDRGASGASWVPGSAGSGPTSEAQSQPEVSVSPEAATLAAIAPHAIVPNPRQPRGVFDPDELDGLATSLADLGMLQPLVVRPVGGGRYELVAGERRLRAAVLAGMDTVPAVVRHTDDADLLKEALVENIHRVQLNPLEEAAAYEQLLEEFGVTQEELAARLGRSRPSISNAIRLLQLPAGVQRRVAAGVLSAGHAKALLALEDADAQNRLAERIVAEGLSVRATEELVRLRLIDEPTRRGSRSRETEVPGLLELQDDLAAALQTRVRIAMGARKGKLTVEFGGVEDLERIVGVIAAGLGTPVEGSIGNGASVGGEVAGRSAPEAPETAELDESALDARIEAATSWTPLDPGPDDELPEP